MESEILQKSSFCFICRSEIVTVKSDPDYFGVLNRHLEVIFVLRKVLQIPVLLLSNRLKGCLSLQAYLKFCPTCQKNVDESFKVFQQISKLNRQWEACQAKIVSTIRNATPYTTTNLEENQDVISFEDEVTKFVRAEKYHCETGSPESPFIEGDLKAQQKLLTEDSVHFERDNSDNNDSDSSHSDHSIYSPAEDDELPEETLVLNKPKRKRKYKSKAKQPPREVELIPLRCLVPGCGQVHDGGAKFNEHSKTHTTQEQNTVKKTGKQFGCSKCAKTFACRAGINEHWRRYHVTYTTKSVICDGCGAAYFTKKQLADHQKGHPTCKRLPNEESGPVQCEKCGENFESSKELGIHLVRIHKIGKFPCKEPNCTRVFSRRDSLNWHVKFHHKQTTGVMCPACGKVLQSQKYLERHNNMYHGGGGEPEFQCNYCERKFHTPALRRNHHRYVHQGKQRKQYYAKIPKDQWKKIGRPPKASKVAQESK